MLIVLGGGIAPFWPVAVSAIGSLGIGAAVGALVADRLREMAARQREARERDALLHLLLTELIQNKSALSVAKIDEQTTTRPYKRIGAYVWPAHETWGEVRTQLARLLPPRDFEPLAKYYFMVAVQRATWEMAADEESDEDRAESAAFLAPLLTEGVEQLQEDAFAVVTKYLPDLSEMGYKID